MDSVPSKPPLTSERGQRSFSWRVLLVVGVIFVLLFAGCAVVLSSAFHSVNLGEVGPLTPHKFEPIPVPQSACPALRRVHDTAEAAGQLWWSYGFAAEPTTSPANYGPFVAQFKPALASFDKALADAQPRVPQQVASQLVQVLLYVRSGEKQFSEAHDLAEYFSGIESNVIDGYVALGNASDLVGNACGFTVAPPVLLGSPSTTSPTR